MSGRRSIVLGLLAGMITTVLLGAAVVALAPEAVPASVAQPTGVPPTASPAVPSGSASAPAPAPAALPAPSMSPAPVSGPALPSASPATSPSVSPVAVFHVGRPAPGLRVRQVGGGTIDLAILRGHPVWIEFMATWCPSCADEFPLMNGFAVRYAGDGLVVATIDVREDEGAVAAFAARLDAAFPVGLDPDGKVSAAWDVVALPTHFFVDATGVVRDGALGGIGPDVMAAGLRTIMPGVTVTP